VGNVFFQQDQAHFAHIGAGIGAEQFHVVAPTSRCQM
jgi:hypothetical protein